MLGQQIKKLRKQKKMTLEEVAGKELTKGMLSLIENNKANPSMESLAYIAKRLEVDVTDLLGEISLTELRETLEKAEKFYNSEAEEMADKYKQITALIEPFIPKLSSGYESARLLDIYSQCLYHESNKNWHHFCDQAATIYDEMNLTSKRADIGIFKVMVKFKDHDYKQALAIFLNERKQIETLHVYIDPMTRVDLDYNEAILYFAVGDSKSAIHAMENGLNYSREHRIFYRINDLYRLATAQALMSNDEEKKAHYLIKLKQYGEFAEDKNSILAYEILKNLSLSLDNHNNSKFMDKVDQYLLDPELRKLYGPWLYLEKGKALYCLKKFHEAIDCLEKVEIPSFIHHPFDFSILYIRDSIKALCYMQLGNWDIALQTSKIAVEHFETLPDSTFKDFAIEISRTVKKASDIHKNKQH
ncbi:MAG: helix-turn-helix transcriptional regulator [Bacillota bacterium]|nr:helix-turn-helix transcriptional regulator [Bacillota bacterium]